MRRKIFLYYIILVVIGVSITAFSTSLIAQVFYKNEVEEKLKTAALLIKHQVIDDIAEKGSVDYNQIALKYAALLDQSANAVVNSGKNASRITFIDYSGAVLGESETNFKLMENHLDRKEVREALEGRVGKDIRLSKTLNTEYFYTAVPIESERVILRISVPLVQLEKINKIILYYSVAGMVAGLIFTVILAFRFSLFITKPVSELINVSHEITKGNYSARVLTKAQDEFGELAEAYNEMAVKLERSVADLRDKNSKLDSIINSMTDPLIAVDKELKIVLINTAARTFFNIQAGQSCIGASMLEVVRNHRINDLIKRTNEENIPLVSEIAIGPPRDMILRVYTSPIRPVDSGSANSGGILYMHDVTNIRKLEQIRTEFVSNVTHELKTPLTSIKGFIETLRGGAMYDTEVAEKFLEIIDVEAERLYTLINDILQLSEIESKLDYPSSEEYNLKAVVDEVVSILKGAADKKDVELASDIDENIAIPFNKDRIKQMLINLIDNAIKYNVEKGGVSIKAFKAEGRVVISVKDTGIGIPAEHIPRIFERFYRVDKGRSRSMGGTGLGLSIVKHIVNLYNGDIKVLSEPGKGSEFIIQLPI